MKVEPGHAVVKDRCVGCGRVVYAYVKLNVELPPPRCQRCAQDAGELPPGRSGTDRPPTAENAGESRLAGAP